MRGIKERKFKEINKYTYNNLNKLYNIKYHYKNSFNCYYLLRQKF